MPTVKNIIAVTAGKGGVGKSTVSTNLAAALHQAGASVGILDADIYGFSIPQMMGDPDMQAQLATGSTINPAVHHGISVISVGFFVERSGAVMWRGPMVHKLLKQFVEDVQWGALDYLIVDLPSGHRGCAAVPVFPVAGDRFGDCHDAQEVSLIDVEKAMSMWKKVQVPIMGVIENMSYYQCPCCDHRAEIFAHGGGAKMAEREGLPLFGEVPLNPQVRQAGDGDAHRA